MSPMFHRREFWAVEAQQYNGSFDLDFLRPNEQIRSGAPDGSVMLIDRDRGDGLPGSTFEVNRGDWVIRLRDGSLHVVGDETFRDEYQPAPTGPESDR